MGKSSWEADSQRPVEKVPKQYTLRKEEAATDMNDFMEVKEENYDSDEDMGVEKQEAATKITEDNQMNTRSMPKCMKLWDGEIGETKGNRKDLAALIARSLVKDPSMADTGAARAEVAQSSMPKAWSHYMKHSTP